MTEMGSDSPEAVSKKEEAGVSPVLGGPTDAVAPRKVIVADGSETFIMYVCILLKRMGFSVIPARDGVEALNLAAVFRPDFALVDVDIPAIDGPMVLRRLKEEGGVPEMEVVMVSVHEDEELFHQCRALGAAGCLTKPVDISLLRDIIYDRIIYENGQKRRSFRVSCCMPISVRWAMGQEDYYAVSFSEGGVFLRTRRPLPAGTLVELRMKLDGDLPLRLKGTVLYRKKVFEHIAAIDPGMAVSFTDVSQQDAGRLSSFVNNIIAGDLSAEQEHAILSIGNAGA